MGSPQRQLTIAAWTAVHNPDPTNGPNFVPPQCTLEWLIQRAQENELGIDLVAPKDRELVKSNNVPILCVMADMSGIAKDGMPFHAAPNNSRIAERVHERYVETIQQASAAGIPYVIAFTGQNTGSLLADQTRYLIDGYQKLAPIAREHNVTIVLEALNTRNPLPWRGHPKVLGRTTKFAANIVERVNHPNFRLCLDVYHSISAGEDPIEMLRQYQSIIGYLHIAGYVQGGSNEEQRGPLQEGFDWKPVLDVVEEVIPTTVPLMLEFLNPSEASEAAVTGNIDQATEICGGLPVGAGS